MVWRRPLYVSTPCLLRNLLPPDLLIAFNVDPEAGGDRNGYVTSEQGKPPDFVLEIASSSTGLRDVTVKRDGYAALGIPEYWRFDDSGGQHHGAPLAGDRLVDGAYQPIPIERIDDRTHQGYSAVLDLHLRWEDGRLGWYDPATGRHIPRFRDERDRANAEQEARIQAEARARELEAEPGDADNPGHLELRTGAAGICPHGGFRPKPGPGSSRRIHNIRRRFMTSARRPHLELRSHRRCRNLHRTPASEPTPSARNLVRSPGPRANAAHFHIVPDS